jgi:(+)-pinoresinol hydroxylase
LFAPAQRAQWEHAQERFRAVIREATFEEREFHRLPLTEAQKDELEYPAPLGIPNLRTFSIGARSQLNPNSPTSGHMWFSPIIPRTGEAVLKANEVFRESSRELGIQGEYRTAAAFYDDVMDTYSFNDHALRRLHETLKDAVDPKGIISAGRYGIWPASSTADKCRRCSRIVPNSRQSL